ncbi:YgaP family membrane protein [Thiolapillus sp.]
MKANVGGIDKILRIVVGLAVIGWGVYAQNWWGALGAIPLFTALMNWCPAYTLFGLSTKKS